MSADTANEVTYNGLYRHGVDEKRRLAIPFRWRPDKPAKSAKSVEEVEFTLLLWKKFGAGACLRVLPPAQWAKLQAEVDARPNSDPTKPALKRMLGTQSIQVKLDTANRICIPEDMKVEAGIGDEAVLAGLLNRFEIWSPERYATLRSADSALEAEGMRDLE